MGDGRFATSAMDLGALNATGDVETEEEEEEVEERLRSDRTTAMSLMRVSAETSVEFEFRLLFEAEFDLSVPPLTLAVAALCTGTDKFAR